MKFSLAPVLLTLGFCAFLPRSGFAQAPAPPLALPTPSAGEIALEGRISVVNAPRHNAMLSAKYFFLPNGKSGPIIPAKNKSISWDAAQFFGGTAQQFKTGALVRVIGKDLGSGKTLPARLIAFIEESELENPANPVKPITPPKPPQTNTPPINPPNATFPIEAEDKGWKFRVTDAGFIPGDSPLLDTKARGGNQLQKWESPAFVVQMEATNPGGKSMAWNDWYQNETIDGSTHSDLTLNARFLSPAGVAYSARSTSHPNAAIVCPSVNPQWPFVWLELFGRDPQAPDGISAQVADGAFRQSAVLEFDAPTSDAPIEINKTISSKSGTQILVKTIQWKREGQGGSMSFTFTTIPQGGEEISDLTGPYILDEQGKQIYGGGGGSSQGNEYKYTSTIPTLPTGATWHARFDITTIQRSRAIAAHRFLVRLKIPITSKEARPPFAQAHDVTRFVSEPNALEALIEDDGPIIKPWWNGRLWLHNTGTDPTRFWDIRKIQVFTPEGKELSSSVENNRNPSYWHRDGSPASPVDNNQRITVRFDSNTPRPTTVRGRIDLQRIQALDYSFTVKTAIPKPGQSIALDEDVKTETNAPFVLRGIRYYQSTKELQGAENEYGIPTSGLALSFEVTPLLVGAQLNLFASRNSAYDDAMRPLTSRWAWGARWLQKDVSNIGHGVNWTVFLPAPAADAKTVELTTEAQERTIPNQTTTIEISNIAIAPYIEPNR